MRRVLGILAIAFLALTGHAQTVFVQSGKIEFERKTNTHRLYFSESEQNGGDEFKKLIPQFRTDYFELSFTDQNTLYKPGKQTDVPVNEFFSSPANSNVVFKDLVSNLSISQKKVFESQFLISDSAHGMQWKIEDETRTIAGYECRKAVSRICDSVVVVAFYTDEILASGGPESFGGLPGMILGIAIPRLYTTWFATKVDALPADEKLKIVPPAKGKKANYKDLMQKVNTGMKDWGDFREKSIWFVTL